MELECQWIKMNSFYDDICSCRANIDSYGNIVKSEECTEDKCKYFYNQHQEFLETFYEYEGLL